MTTNTPSSATPSHPINDVELGFRAFDADNHYYEAEDAFTRHLDPKWHSRCMQWAEINGKRRLLVGGQVNRFIPNPTFDPIARPGSLADYFRGKNTGGQDALSMFGDLDPIADRPEFRNRDARLKVMDSQGIEATFLFPTLGVGMQHSLAHDIDATHAAFNAFNRWLEEDWGYDHQGRLYAAPVIVLSDVDQAIAETDRVLAAGAKIVCIMPSPIPMRDGSTLSPAWPTFDPVWARLNEAGITVGMHAGDTGAMRHTRVWEPADSYKAFQSTALQQVITHERHIFDALAALVCHGLFDRFPNLRIASVENGGMFVPRLFHEFEVAFGKMPHKFASHPIETFKRHISVAPFFEDDIEMIAEVIGIDRVLFGSDWPHAEGLANPTSYVDDIPGFDDAQRRMVMYDNARALATPRPA